MIYKTNVGIFIRAINGADAKLKARHAEYLMRKTDNYSFQEKHIVIQGKPIANHKGAPCVWNRDYADVETVGVINTKGAIESAKIHNAKLCQARKEQKRPTTFVIVDPE